MKKPWSITTTLRNPERVRDFLIVLQELENIKWDIESQKQYQILLIQNRLYGYGSNQFYKGLSKDQVALIDDISQIISFQQAEEIFNAKDYEDPAMRGRQSINPLKKMAFVVIQDNKIVITKLGKLFLKDQFDFEEVFLNSFLKWQVPNPVNRDFKLQDGFDIKPFIATLHLVKQVNAQWNKLGNNSVGLSKQEFSLFVPTLINFKDINTQAQKIINLRLLQQKRSAQGQRAIFDNYSKKFVSEFLGTTDDRQVHKLSKNLRDYGDNTIRYFRLTKYIYIRGNGFYVDLEPRRSVEIDSLLAYDNAQSKSFQSTEEYIEYITDTAEPKLPWATIAKYIESIESVAKEIQEYESELQKSENMKIKNYQAMTENDIKNYLTELRKYRKNLQDEQEFKKSQGIEQIESYIKDISNIYSFDNKAILLEKLTTLAMYALDDALRIQPNYPVGDDNEPTFTAPANTPDIECFYKAFNSICEVTMLTGRNQWYNEGQPVMRHLRDFENKHSDKTSYCLFIAPALHRDTVNTFWNAVKYGYEGKKQKIVPISISHFVLILDTLLQIKQKNELFSHKALMSLYDDVLNVAESIDNSNEWIEDIPNVISSWKQSITS